ncbi:MAG: sensor histidine kinase [Bacteroidales bacterium]|nr:sensor histidine kinase [Bacteroidales bacterium]MBQ7490453.1 sensor histidine kinase [Bacteroidales bacterium]
MKDLSMHIIDILQNSTRAKAKNIELLVEEDVENDKLTLQFKDDGCGMSEEMAAKVTDPFVTTRTTRKVGLGLPLLKQNAEITGGTFELQSQLGKGTTVTATFGLSHIDRKPMGDLAGAVVLTMTSYPDIRFVFRYKKQDIDFVLDTDEVHEALEGVSIQNPEIISYLREMIEENIKPQ